MVSTCSLQPLCLPVLDSVWPLLVMLIDTWDSKWSCMELAITYRDPKLWPLRIVSLIGTWDCKLKCHVCVRDFIPKETPPSSSSSTSSSSSISPIYTVYTTRTFFHQPHLHAIHHQQRIHDLHHHLYHYILYNTHITYIFCAIFSTSSLSLSLSPSSSSPSSFSPSTYTNFFINLICMTYTHTRLP